MKCEKQERRVVARACLSRAIRVFLVSVIAIGGVGTARAQHEGDVEVGTTADRQLGAIVAQDAPSPLHPFSQFGLNGWLGDEPGFEALLKPEGELFPLEEGCEIRLDVWALDSALRVFDSGLNEIHVGENLLLGGHELHEHAFWFIDAEHPAYDPNQEAWAGTFTLIDTGGTGYSQSHPIQLLFTTACAPAQTLSAVCRTGGKVVVKLRGARADAVLTARLDGDPSSDTEMPVNDRGKGKARFKGVADGPHQIEVVECGTTGNTECP